jgi:hypothetical protein
MKYLALRLLFPLCTPWISGSCVQRQQPPAPQVRAAAGACSPAVLAVDGHPIWVDKQGAGRVTVAFEAGFGNDSSVWAELAPKIRAAGAQTFVYDRAGKGKSTIDTRAPYSIDNDVHILRTAWTACGVTGPIVLVGHAAAKAGELAPYRRRSTRRPRPASWRHRRGGQGRRAGTRRRRRSTRRKLASVIASARSRSAHAAVVEVEREVSELRWWSPRRLRSAHWRREHCGGRGRAPGRRAGDGARHGARVGELAARWPGRAPSARAGVGVAYQVGELASVIAAALSWASSNGPYPVLAASWSLLRSLLSVAP